MTHRKGAERNPPRNGSPSNQQRADPAFAGLIVTGYYGSLGPNGERGEYVLAGLPRGAAARQQCCTFTRRHRPGK